MNKFYAFMWEIDDPESSHNVAIDEEYGFIVVAEDMWEVSALLDDKGWDLPSWIDQFVTGALELGEADQDIAGILEGPIHMRPAEVDRLDIPYWRRDFRKDHWVEYSKYQQTGDYWGAVLDKKEPG
ncbi:hypothetical protein [Aliamphritea hakodatensis]|uniref:hypothetical protein n=1 Tax=Aliamphritea hakodatensis TaxID=2895352 RepID=UPI0022FDAFAE|nr:hypothetical protein [Aliamphritea hakodatensis]